MEGLREGTKPGNVIIDTKDRSLFSGRVRNLVESLKGKLKFRLLQSQKR